MLLQKLFQPTVLFQVYMLSLAFADIDCLFSPNQGITLPIKKRSLNTWQFFIPTYKLEVFFIPTTYKLEVFYSFTEDKRDKKVFFKAKNCKSLLMAILWAITRFFWARIGQNKRNVISLSIFF